MSADVEAGIAERGYEREVPMGGELSRVPCDAAAPSFLLEALRDPREASLERMQIVKSWIADGVAQERVYDVACADGRAPDPGTHRCDLQVEPPSVSDCSFDEYQRAVVSLGELDRPGLRSGPEGLLLTRMCCRFRPVAGVRGMRFALAWIRGKALRASSKSAPSPLPSGTHLMKWRLCEELSAAVWSCALGG